MGTPLFITEREANDLSNKMLELLENYARPTNETEERPVNDIYEMTKAIRKINALVSVESSAVKLLNQDSDTYSVRGHLFELFIEWLPQDEKQPCDQFEFVNKSYAVYLITKFLSKYQLEFSANKAA